MASYASVTILATTVVIFLMFLIIIYSELIREWGVGSRE
jgi:hypothetical protein